MRSLPPWKSNDGDGLDIMSVWLVSNNGNKNYESIFRGTYGGWKRKFKEGFIWAMDICTETRVWNSRVSWRWAEGSTFGYVKNPRWTGAECPVGLEEAHVAQLGKQRWKGHEITQGKQARGQVRQQHWGPQSKNSGSSESSWGSEVRSILSIENWKGVVKLNITFHFHHSLTGKLMSTSSMLVNA